MEFEHKSTDLRSNSRFTIHQNYLGKCLNAQVFKTPRKFRNTKTEERRSVPNTDLQTSLKPVYRICNQTRPWHQRWIYSYMIGADIGLHPLHFIRCRKHFLDANALLLLGTGWVIVQKSLLPLNLLTEAAEKINANTLHNQGKRI